MGSKGWDGEVLDFALGRAKNGESASCISAQIHQKFGVLKTRNAVIGVLHRRGKTVGLPRFGKGPKAIIGRKVGRKAAAAYRARFKPTSSEAPQYASEPIPQPLETDVARVSFLDLDEIAIAVALPDGTSRTVRQHCKFPVLAEPAGPAVKQFCGDQRVSGLPYCEGHAARCFGPPRPKGWLPFAPQTATIPDLEKEDALTN